MQHSIVVGMLHLIASYAKVFLRIAGILSTPLMNIDLDTFKNPIDNNSNDTAFPISLTFNVFH